MSESAKGTSIVGLGNSLRGDDGVGAAIVDELQRHLLPDDVILSHQGINGLLTALAGQGFQRIIIVDAAYMGRSPGEWVRFTPDDICLDSHASNSWHGMGLAEILPLIEALAVPLPELVLYGIQPLTIQPLPELSESVHKAVHEVCTAILAEVYEQSPLMDKER